jgi:hypothetical protein
MHQAGVVRLWRPDHFQPCHARPALQSSFEPVQQIADV